MHVLDFSRIPAQKGIVMHSWCAATGCEYHFKLRNETIKFII